MKELIDEVERLSAIEKWQLVRHVLHTLEHEQVSPPAPSDWHERLRATYGILADDPIERLPQLPLEEREPIE